MLGRIRTVTVATPDVAALVAAYERDLGYRTVDRSPVPASLAAAWGAPAVAGRAQALLAPGGTGDSYLRFVESRRPPGYVPFRHLGWNAAEHVVQDVDALGVALAGSAFAIVGPPADLSFSDQIRAMQVRGPADEVLYLTRIRGRLAAFDTPDAHHPVDRVFIVILGAPDLGGALDWYATHLGVPRAPVIPSRISVLARAYGHDPETRYGIAALPLGGQCYIEADAMPAAAAPRPCLPGELPPAIAIVGFEVPRLPEGIDWLGPPASTGAPGSGGGRVATCRGPAGELIELIEAG